MAFSPSTAHSSSHCATWDVGVSTLPDSYYRLVRYSLRAHRLGGDMHYHFLKKMVEDGKIKLDYVPTMEQTADAMTKGLAREKHELFIGQMGLRHLG